jgi:hypothetical protein
MQIDSYSLGVFVFPFFGTTYGTPESLTTDVRAVRTTTESAGQTLVLVRGSVR